MDEPYRHNIAYESMYTALLHVNIRPHYGQTSFEVASLIAIVFQRSELVNSVEIIDVLKIQKGFYKDFGPIVHTLLAHYIF